MQKDDIYLTVLEYMCENYDYSLYATDFNFKRVSALQRYIASIPSSAGASRAQLIKVALQDFFHAIYQRVFIYEDEERLKIVKYFDNGAINEGQDRQIHALRQELISFKKDFEEDVLRDSLFMFDKNARGRFELAMLALSEKTPKEILREQIALVFELKKRDIVVFLNERIFVKKFIFEEKEEFLYTKSFIVMDKKFTNNFWEVLSKRLEPLFKQGFVFFSENKKLFYANYPSKFLQLINNLILNSFTFIDERDALEYAKVAYDKFLPKILEECAKHLLKETLHVNTKAINFLKSYSESVVNSNKKMTLKRQPLMSKTGKIYNFQHILSVLKKLELLQSKISHKKLEIAKSTQRVKKALQIVHRSEDEMLHLQQRRRELLNAIEKVEIDIQNLGYEEKKNLDKDRLEFAKRDLLEAFKQVEVRIKTQEYILKNTHTELDKWQEKRSLGDVAKSELESEYIEFYEEYKQICEALALAFKKEPLDL
ncbi:MAG TPA: hypothetical protein CFH79_06395 [Sulfurospirillum sp. UBA11407]|nr:MAG TPA: hypothetical protein CFH79_06395 [Sulfurospirillum sp. UBA11407]